MYEVPCINHEMWFWLVRITSYFSGKEWIRATRVLYARLGDRGTQKQSDCKLKKRNYNTGSLIKGWDKKKLVFTHSLISFWSNR